MEVAIDAFRVQGWHHTHSRAFGLEQSRCDGTDLVALGCISRRLSEEVIVTYKAHAIRLHVDLVDAFQK